jgi:CHASE2 domain
MGKRKRRSRARLKTRNKHEARKISFARRLLRATPMLMFVLLLVFVFSGLGVLDKLEAAALDIEARVAKTPAPENTVAVVTIDDDDYEHLFNNRSPLAPDKLYNLIDKIARTHAKLIAVDIDTSDVSFKDGFKVESYWPPIVWERDFEKKPESLEHLEAPRSVLGGKGAEYDASSGLALLLQHHGKVRTYLREIETTKGALPSFAWEIVQRGASDRAKSLKPAHGPLFIRYSGDREGSHRLDFSAQKFLEWYETKWKNDPASSPYSGKIVLLGTAHGAGAESDQYITPLGEMFGVRINASVVETELAGGGYPLPSTITIALLELFGAVALVFIFHVLRPLRALLLSLLIIPPLALLCSLISFSSYWRWDYFAVVLVGVLIYELYMHYRVKMIERIYEDVEG